MSFTDLTNGFGFPIVEAFSRATFATLHFLTQLMQPLAFCVDSYVVTGWLICMQSLVQIQSTTLLLII